MSYCRTLVFALILAVVGLAAAAPALAQSYGTGDQELIIAATEFRPLDISNTAYQLKDDGYLVGIGDYIAPIHLPDGAAISKFCVYAYSNSGAMIGVSGLSRSLAEPGQTVDQTSWGNVIQAPSDGYAAACTDGDLGYTIRSMHDPGTGVARYSHHLRAHIPSSASGIGGVRIIWHRQVSPPPDAATFLDVPASDPGFQFIEALVASGITAGCGGGNYCPDATLTRRQMAVFLSKGLGLHWPN